jgi:hypothetical protein
MKSELGVVDDVVDHGIVFEERNDAHFPLALGTAQGIKLIDFPYHLCPTPAGDPLREKEL